MRATWGLATSADAFPSRRKRYPTQIQYFFQLQIHPRMVSIKPTRAFAAPTRLSAAKLALAPFQRATSFVDCFNMNPCCERWADGGECKANPDYMRGYCRAACGLCHPSFNA